MPLISPLMPIPPENATVLRKINHLNGHVGDKIYAECSLNISKHSINPIHQELI